MGNTSSTGPVIPTTADMANNKLCILCALPKPQESCMIHKGTGGAICIECARDITVATFRALYNDGGIDAVQRAYGEITSGLGGIVQPGRGLRV